MPKFEKSLTQWTDYNYILFVIITFGLFPKPSVFVTQTHFGPCRTVADKHQEICNSWPSGTIRGWKMAYRLALKLLQRANSVLYQGKICHLEMPGTERHIRRSGTNRKICRLLTKKYTRKTLIRKLLLYLIRINDNEFLLAKKYLSMKGVFSVENRILDSVGMSLPSTQQTAQTQSTYVYRCI